MSKVKDTQAEMLDLIIDKHSGNKLDWKPRENEDSFEADLGKHSIHIDRKPIGTIANYRIWVFDEAGEATYNFDTKNLDDRSPKDARFDSYSRLAGYIYKDMKDALSLEKLNSVLGELRAK